MSKHKGGLGLKDLRWQGVSLVAKWIFRALQGEEPWKILIGHNISKFVPKKSPNWKGLGLCDLIVRDFKVRPYGPPIFREI